MKNTSQTAYFKNHAWQLYENGYCAIPLEPQTKRPVQSVDWMKYCWKQPDPNFITTQIERHPNMGVGLACGRQTVAIDIDAKDARNVAKIKDVAFEIFGETPLIRQGENPKIALLYRTSEPVISCRTPSIDIIGLGAQLVAYGIHPKTKREYRWIGQSTPTELPCAALPSITNVKIWNFYCLLAQEKFGVEHFEMCLAYDKINYTPPMSSISVLFTLLFRSMLFGKENAAFQAQKILTGKYASTGTGLNLELKAGGRMIEL
ncbi:MAG: bifunctional DNA primase/polymerase [Paracoccaceae bacterium]